MQPTDATDGEATQTASLPTAQEAAEPAAEAEVPLSTNICQTISRFCAMYPEAKKSRLNKSAPACLQLSRLEELLASRVPKEWKSKWSIGQGKWASVPWLAFYNPANSSIQSGLYAVYLFRTDMSGFYLTIGQGVTRIMAALSKNAAAEALGRITQLLRPRCLEQLPSIFSESMQAPIDLRAPKTMILPASYEKSAVAWAYYEVDGNHTEEDLSDQLLQCLQMVDALQVSQEYSEVSTAINTELTEKEEEKQDSKRRRVSMTEDFQCRPLITPLFDESSAAKLEEMVTSTMNGVDREHTMSIIAQHKVRLEHLMYGMGFNSTGPTDQRKQLLLGCLTGSFDDKPSMRADCAGILIEGVIAHGKELQSSFSYFHDEDAAWNTENEPRRPAPKRTTEQINALGPEITSQYAHPGDWKVYADSLPSKARKGFKVYVSPSGDRVATMGRAREAGFEGSKI